MISRAVRVSKAVAVSFPTKRKFCCIVRITVLSVFLPDTAYLMFEAFLLIVCIPMNKWASTNRGNSKFAFLHII